MRGKTWIFFVCLIYLQGAYSQKHDYVWLMGYEGGSISPQNDTFGITIFDFNPDTILTVKDNQDIEIGFDLANASICNEEGNLLFYSNGVSINDASHQTMLNGDALNEEHWQGYILPQGVLILPYPDSDNLYALLHGTERLYVTNEITVSLGDVWYSLIDMSVNGGLGEVIQKKDSLVHDTLDWGRITAVKHGNGRDWWIIIREYCPESNCTTNVFYKILLSPKGIDVLEKQSIGTPSYSGVGQSIFSPDGKLFANLYSIDRNHPYIIDIYEFDRCTGLLSNQKKIITQRTGAFISSSGLAISSNSRYLYQIINDKIIQYDLYSDDIESTAVVVATHDGFVDFTPTQFKSAQLAPDGKIYITSISSNKYIHIIHNPNNKGVLCNIEQDIRIPTTNKGHFPNFPNYRLQEWPDSPCDTLSQDTVVSSVSILEKPDEVTIYPNPIQVGEQLQITPAGWTVTTVYDVYGRLVSKDGNLPKVGGMYWVVLEKQKQRSIKKIIVYDKN